VGGSRKLTAKATAAAATVIPRIHFQYFRSTRI
jgi:hypothetical protein